jgi:secreted Zn-dependent insulinase-like peptidase
MNKEILEEIANKIINKIDKLEYNTEISNSMLWKEEICENKIEFDDLFELNNKIIEACERKDYNLNFDRYKGAYVGLPWEIPFIKEKRD